MPAFTEIPLSIMSAAKPPWSKVNLVNANVRKSPMKEIGMRIIIMSGWVSDSNRIAQMK